MAVFCPHNGPKLFNKLSNVEQVAEENLAKTDQAATDVSDPKLSRLVIETGISAFAQPAKLLVPLTAFVHSLRIVSLALQIFYNNANAHLSGRHMSSELSTAIPCHAIQHLFCCALCSLFCRPCKCLPMDVLREACSNITSQ